MSRRMLGGLMAVVLATAGGCSTLPDGVQKRDGPTPTGEGWPVASMAVVRATANATVDHVVNVKAVTPGGNPAADGTVLTVSASASELDGPANYPLDRFLTNALQSDGTTLSAPLTIAADGRGSIIFQVRTDWVDVASRVVIRYTVHPTAGGEALEGAFLVEKPTLNPGGGIPGGGDAGGES